MLLVETTASFQLYDHNLRKVVRHQGYTVIPNTSFVGLQIAYKKLRVIAELNDEATDDEWLKYVKDCDGDLDLAKSSFVTNFAIAEAVQPTPAGDAVKKSKAPKAS